MGEATLTLIIVFLLLMTICFIGVLVLRKDAKEFHIHFDIFNGFDFSGSFYSEQQTPEDQ